MEELFLLLYVLILSISRLGAQKIKPPLLMIQPSQKFCPLQKGPQKILLLLTKWSLNLWYTRYDRRSNDKIESISDIFILVLLSLDYHFPNLFVILRNHHYWTFKFEVINNYQFHFFYIQSTVLLFFLLASRIKKLQKM